MISTLDELIRYRQILAGKIPSLRERIEIQTPGINREEEEILATRFPGISESYLKVAKAIDLHRLIIGYFQFDPFTSARGDLVSNLSDANSADLNPWYHSNLHYHAYEIASWEADRILVVHSNGVFRRGDILFQEESGGECPLLLAHDFLTFLLLVGSLDSIRDQKKESPSLNAVGEFENCVESFLPNDAEAKQAWQRIAEVVLS